MPVIRRIKVNSLTATQLLWSSDRTCNLCMHERHHLEIHHINGDPGDNDYSNLIVLCRNCHSEATAAGLGRKISSRLLAKYKSYWEVIVETRRQGATTSSRAEPRVRRGPVAAARRIADQFERAMCQRNARAVLALFTPPRKDTERMWLVNYVLGGDLGPARSFIRLFATRGFGYKIVEFDIKAVRVKGPRQVDVHLEEWLTWWGNGGWDAVPRRRRTVLTIVKFGSKWLVERYREPSQPIYRHKYGGLNG